MTTTFRSLATLACFATMQICLAQAPAGAPANTTGLCNDGTYTTGATKKGACRGHKGIKEWYAPPASDAAPEKPATPTAKATTPAAAATTSTPVTAAGQAPAGATGVCNDGTYSTTATKKGACRGHQGVKEWYAATPGAAKASVQTEPADPVQFAPVPAAAPAPTAMAPAPAKTNSAASKQAAPTAMAPGGGAGQVWLNTSTNVYHCSGSRYYGKTKAGAYMTEADAKAKGARAERGKECSAQ